jgi:hypothetical protein
MAFDLHLSIPENSPAGQAVQRLVADEHVTPEQAVRRILNEAVGQQSQKTQAQGFWGAFTSQEDVVVHDEQTETSGQDRAIRVQRRLPNLEVAETMPVFGMFAENPEFSEAMDQVMASRHERYYRFTA